MSSTLDNSSILATIAALESQLSALKAQLSGSPVSAGKAGRVVKSKKTVAKDPNAPKRPANAWITFSKRVRDLLKAHGYTEKAVGVELVQFAATLKDENSDLVSWTDADILARRAAWSAPEVSRWESAHGAKGKGGSAANSVVTTESKATDKGEDKAKAPRKNPWAGLSEDERKAKVAKMAAAKAAKKAAVTTPEPVVTAPEPVVTAPDNNIVANTSVAPVVKDAPRFQRMSLQGSPYLINKATGHCYKRNKDGSQGDWAGIFHSTGGPVNNGPYIDDSVTEPTIDGWDNDELVV